MEPTVVRGVGEHPVGQVDQAPWAPGVQAAMDMNPKAWARLERTRRDSLHLLPIARAMLGALWPDISISVKPQVLDAVPRQDHTLESKGDTIEFDNPGKPIQESIYAVSRHRFAKQPAHCRFGPDRADPCSCHPDFP